MLVPGADGSLFGRSARSWSLSLMYLGGAGGCLMGLTYPMSRQAPLGLIAAIGLGCLAVALVLFVAGNRARPIVFHLLVGSGIGLVSLLVASSHSRAGVIMTSFAYPWLCLYASHFMRRRAALGYGTLSGAGYAIAITATGLPDLATPWLVLTVTVVVVSVVTASLVTQLRRQSETDPLTGLPNRAWLDRAGERELAQAGRYGRPLAVAVIDLDGLKTVNDTKGHTAGDALLARVAREFAGPLRTADLLARIGGDEFALLLPETDEQGAAALIERIRAASSAGFSAGSATYRRGEELPALLHRADIAMYRDKQSHPLLDQPRLPCPGRHCPAPAGATAPAI